MSRGQTAEPVTTLLALLEEGFDRRSWHGTNLRGALRGLSAARAAWRTAPKRHNVWEITLHAAYWKYTVWRRLTGEKRGAFALKGSNWWCRPAGQADESEWRADVALLSTEHRRLLSAVERLKPADLLRPAPSGRGMTIGAVVRGVAAHDLYHAGQIQLLKRLAP
jgi:hypothetical protein